MIAIDALTKRYKKNRGVFDLSFAVKKGETFGYLGPNGAGKTTTIRHLMGFVKPDSGSCSVNGLDCWRDAAKIQRFLGYIPGEIAFFNGMKGDAFLDLISEMRGIKQPPLKKMLIERFELDTKVTIRKMSKGMKQKLGIITAFMHDPAVLILDEPSSGLDPLMQNRFVELVEEEKRKGKTILMSSHVFEEVTRTCDRTGIIRDGKLVAVENVHSLNAAQQKSFIVTLEAASDADVLKKRDCKSPINNKHASKWPWPVMLTILSKR